MLLFGIFRSCTTVILDFLYSVFIVVVVIVLFVLVFGGFFFFYCFHRVFGEGVRGGGRERDRGCLSACLFRFIFVELFCKILFVSIRRRPVNSEMTFFDSVSYFGPVVVSAVVAALFSLLFFPVNL